MTLFSPRAFVYALPLCAISQAAFADLTPAQVWGDWRNYLQSFGYQITATETTNGANLTVSDINLSFPVPDAGTMDMGLGTIGFNQNSDGTVAILLPDQMPITVTGTEAGEGRDTVTVRMNVTQGGHTLTASGSPEQMTYLHTAQSLQLNLDSIEADGETLGADNARMAVVGTNLNTTTTMTVGDVRSYEQTGSIASVSYDMFFLNPDKADAQGAMKGSITGLTMNGTGSIPLGIPNTSDMSAMVAAGFDIAGSFAFESGSTSMDIKDPENSNFTMQSSSQGGALGVKMGASGLAYSGSQRGLNSTVTVDGMPFPFEVSMSEGAFNIAMPVTKSDDPQDFAFGIKLADFTMSDFIWSMFDPAAQLPRDPATIALDLSGKAKLLVDWMNPEEAAQVADAPPGELQSLTMSNLLVNAVGAKLEGSGDITFDGAGPPMVPGLGNPVGAVNMALSGGNALIDKLVAMGFIPQDQAMGARMMMGLFAVPGDGPDTLKSKIEFTQDGQILANGQRIR